MALRRRRRVGLRRRGLRPGGLDGRGLDRGGLRGARCEACGSCANSASGGGRQRACAHHIAHARQFIETGLHDGVRVVVGRHGARVDLDDQRFQLVAQVAHRLDARHARAALERVQLALQFRDPLLVAPVVIPGGQRDLRGLEQLGGLLAVDVGDLVIEFLGRRLSDLEIGDLGLRIGNRAAAVGGPPGFRAGEPECRSGARGFRLRQDPVRRRLDHRGRLRQFRNAHRRTGVGGRHAEFRVDFRVEPPQPREQRRLVDEERRGLVDVRHDVFDRADRIRERRQPGVGQAVPAVENLAHEMIQRLGDADAVVGFRHLRAAAQGVDGAIHGLRQMVGRGLARALAQVLADLRQMARGLLAVDVVQQGIHGGRPGGLGGRGWRRFAGPGAADSTGASMPSSGA